MCSDGAAVNRAVYNQLVDELGPQYLSMFCLSHKFELALNAFQISKLNEKQLHRFLFFKRSPLRWQLFKSQSIFMELPRRKYKLLSGTRWVEHRTEALFLSGFVTNKYLLLTTAQSKSLNQSLKGCERV